MPYLSLSAVGGREKERRTRREPRPVRPTPSAEEERREKKRRNEGRLAMVWFLWAPASDATFVPLLSSPRSVARRAAGQGREQKDREASKARARASAGRQRAVGCGARQGEKPPPSTKGKEKKKKTGPRASPSASSLATGAARMLTAQEGSHRNNKKELRHCLRVEGVLLKKEKGCAKKIRGSYRQKANYISCRGCQENEDAPAAPFCRVLAPWSAPGWCRRAVLCVWRPQCGGFCKKRRVCGESVGQRKIDMFRSGTDTWCRDIFWFLAEMRRQFFSGGAVSRAAAGQGQDERRTASAKAT